MALSDEALAQQGRESIKVGSKSFALASLVLPPRIRDDASMLYSWCRYCDDVIDGQEMGHGQIEDYRDGQVERLEVLKARSRAALKGFFASSTIAPELSLPNAIWNLDPNLEVPNSMKPVDQVDRARVEAIFSGLSGVVARNGIRPQHIFELLKGFEMDVSERTYRSIDDILDYSYHVAGVVGVMMAIIMGVREYEETTLDRASDLGLAFQLTNIARDVIDDAKAGRVFVPQELLIKNGAPIDPVELAKSENWPAAHEAALDLLDVAEGYYRSARTGVRRLPFRCAWAITAALKVYREIGEVLRREGPDAWNGRVGASKGRKISLALMGGGAAMTRKSAKDYPRDGFYERPKA